MIKFRPMLSGKAPDDLSTLNYPLAVSPKLDGFRCIVIDGVAMSRNLKPIRNEYAQELFGRHEYNGYDGELIVGDPTAKDCFNVTSSGVTSREGEPDVRLFVFDNCFHSDYWAERFASVNMNDNVIVHLHEVCHNHNELLRFEEEYLEQGYEGLMIRALNGPMKSEASYLNYARKCLRRTAIFQQEKLLNMLNSICPQIEEESLQVLTITNGLLTQGKSMWQTKISMYR